MRTRYISIIGRVHAQTGPGFALRCARPIRARADLGKVRFEGSVILVTGTHADTRDRITFVGDTRYMITLLDAVQESGERQMAWVEAHTIWREVPATQV